MGEHDDFREWRDAQPVRIASKFEKPRDHWLVPESDVNEPEEPARPNTHRILRPSCRPGNWGDAL